MRSKPNKIKHQKQTQNKTIKKHTSVFDNIFNDLPFVFIKKLVFLSVFNLSCGMVLADCIQI